MPGGPSPVVQAANSKTDGRSYLQVAEGRSSLPPAEILASRQRQELDKLARLHQQQREQLEKSERQSSPPGSLNTVENMEQIRSTMDTLLDILQTIFRTLTCVAEKLPAGDAKSDILALTAMVGPLDTLGGEVAYSTHE